MRVCLLVAVVLFTLPALVEAAPPRPQTGVVTWFNISKGLGEIQYKYKWRGQQKTKSYLAHWSQVNTVGSFRTLQAGQSVQFFQAKRIPAPVKAVNRELKRAGIRYKPADIAVNIKVLAGTLR